MTCPACGTPTVAGARFCFACGVPLPEAHGDLEAERRVVTVLFADLSDFTSWAEEVDPERVGVVIDRVLSTLTGVVADYGGHVDKLTGDGLMAVWGAPTAHEDDVERAVRAAATMQSVVARAVQEEGGGGRRLGLRIGLNTGEVLAGVQAHLSYTVVGDTVNTASRLSDAAGVGAVLAGRDTALPTMAVASWRALAPLRLKGKRDAVEAFELVGLRRAGSTRLGLGDEAPFVGRDAELGLLVGRLLDVTDRGVPRAVVVTGDPGVGKTRLARELSRFAGELPGTRVLWGRCAPYGEGRDLAAVGEMVRTACGVADDDDATTVRDRVDRTVARLASSDRAGVVPSDTAEGLHLLLGVAGPSGAAVPVGATPGLPVGGDPVRRAVAVLLSALAAEGPLVLVVDDLHWATPLMLEGLLDVVDGLTGPALLLGAGRHDAVSGSTWWEGLPSVELLPLMPLESAATERLLRHYLGESAVDPGVQDALLSRAQGNPFFLAELLHLLVDRGVLHREGAGWVLQGDLVHDVPAGVQAVLAARIDGLDGPAKGVLRDASVLGLRVSTAGLRAVGEASGHGDPEVVDAAVVTLVERRLLEPDPDGEGTDLRFAHTLVRDVAYSGVAKADRARRHAAAARFAAASPRLLDVETAAQAEQALRLATEMGLPTGDLAWTAREPGFVALARLGHAALGRDDATGAVRLLRSALGLVAPGATLGDVAGGVGAGGAEIPVAAVAEVRVALAEALTTRRQLDEAQAELDLVLADATGLLRSSALGVLGELRRARGDLTGARAALGEALSGAPAGSVVRSAVLRRLGLLDYVDGRLRHAEERFREAQQLAVEAGDDRAAAWALQHLAWSATTRGDYDLAEQVLDEAGELFTALDDPGGLGWVAGTEGLVRLLQGRFGEARDLVRALLPFGEASEDAWGVAALLTIDALAAAELGDVVVADDEATRAAAAFADLGDAWGRSLALLVRGVAARAEGRVDDATALLDEAIDVAERGHHPVTGSLAEVVAGYVRLDSGDADGAESCATRAAALLSGLDLEPHAALGATVLQAQVLRARGDLPGALAVLDTALATDDRPALIFPRRQALAHRAGVLVQLGRLEEARRSAEDAVRHPSEDVRSEVLALRAQGAVRRACGDEPGARESLARALAVAESTGHRAEVAPTRRLLDAP